jgi:hypothetical protein
MARSVHLGFHKSFGEATEDANEQVKNAGD